MKSTIQDYASIILNKKRKLKEYAVNANSENIFKNTLLALCKQLNLDSTDASVKEAIKNELVTQFSGVNPAQLTPNVAQAIEEKGDIKAAIQAVGDASAKMSQEGIKLADTIINFLNAAQADQSNEQIKWVAGKAASVKAQESAFTVEDLAKVCTYLDGDWNTNESTKVTAIIQPALKMISALGGQAPQLQSLARLQQQQVAPAPAPAPAPVAPAAN